VSGFGITVDLSHLGLDELVEGAEAAARPAAQAGAQVFYDAVKANVRKLRRKTGNLDASIYQVYSRDHSAKGRAEYHVSWNHTKAPHGHLLEFGHVQRYVTYIDKRGQWKTLVRPEMRGKPKPGGKRDQALLARQDAYYVLLKGGPRIVGAKPFIRPAATPEQQRRVRNAMVDRWWWELESRGLL
jgi:hypothetical protein